MGALDDYEKGLAYDIMRHAHQQERNQNQSVSVTGVYFDSAGVTLVPGQTFQDCGHVQPDNASNQGISYSTSNANVAVIDGNGVITAIAPGSCIVFAVSNDGNYTARACVNVNAGAAAAAQSQAGDVSWNNSAAATIQATAANGTANLVATKTVSLNSTVLSALASRPDVSLLIAFPYKGHSYLMAVPAGYNLYSKADSSGNVSLLTLSAVNDGKIIVTKVN